jgi:hypothetical protein
MPGMGLLIAQISQSYDTTLPRDRFVNVLWFDKNSPGILEPLDADGLASDLANLYHDNRQASCETRVKFYNADDPKPRPVIGQAVVGEGLSPSYGRPREIALCLSFYADRNLPKRRGRIYLPVSNGPFPNIGVRPTDAQMQPALDLATGLSDLGGADIDWCVHSVVDQQHYKVTNAWVDDEWDTMRSRGLRATRRLSASVSG